MLINQAGEKQGLIEFSKALEQAQKFELDLDQVTPTGSEPIVCNQ